MASTRELWLALYKRRPDTVCLGGVCYIRLEGGNLAKVELISNGSYTSGIQWTILNPRLGFVDSLTLHNWDLPRGTKFGYAENAAWDICRPTVNIEALSELAEEYLRLFEQTNLESR